MAKDTQICHASANAACLAVTTRANAGFLKIYDGVQPNDGNTALGSQNLLATIQLAATAFNAPVNGVAGLATTLAVTAAKTGVASWFRITDPAGNQVIDGSIGVTGSGSNIEFGSVNIQQNAQVAVSAYNYSIQEGGQ